MAVQDHIHMALELGGAPEYAPIYRWLIRSESYEVGDQIIATHRRTANGKSRFHVLQNEYGPVQFTNYQFIIKVIDDDNFTAQQYINILRGMNGRTVYFVPPDHAANGVSHANDVVSMRMQIRRRKNNTSMLNYWDFEVELIDNYTV